MRKCENGEMWECRNVKMRKCENEGKRKCGYWEDQVKICQQAMIE